MKGFTVALNIENRDFRVTRQVVKVTPENVADNSLSFFMDDHGYDCRAALFPKSFEEEAPNDAVEGVQYHELTARYPESFFAAFGDYIVIRGHKDAYTATAEELESETSGSAIQAKR